MGNNERIETLPAQGTAASQQIPFPEEIKQAIEKSVDEKVEKSVDEKVEKRVKETEIRYTEVLGVFVALFTFVSINIQIFSKISSLNNALIFILLMFLCLGGFSLLLHVILTAKKYSLIIIICGLVIAAIFIFLLPNTPLSLEESTELEQISQRVSNLEKAFEVFLQIKK